MSNVLELKKIINQLQVEDVKNFVELDRVFESIVSENSDDIKESLDILEVFFCRELKKNMAKEV